MVTLMQRRREMMRLASASPAPTIDDYVQDGIILWLDGIENTRSGHNASATKWEDLSGNARDYTYASTSVIGDKYCKPNNKLTNTKDRPTNQVTIEIVMDFVSSGSSQMILPWGGNAYKTVWISSSGSPIYFSAGNSNASKGIAVRSGINTYAATSTSSMFFNGVSDTIVSGSATWQNGAHYIGYYSSSSPRTVSSKIYAIRMYNRALTAAELLQNAQIDRARFGT